MPTTSRQFKRIPHWVAVDYASLLHLQERTREWLLDSASLTLRIKNYCQSHDMGNFSVRVLSQGMGIPSNDEVQRLRLKSRRYALIREVLLYCGETPVIFAASLKLAKRARVLYIAGFCIRLNRGDRFIRTGFSSGY